MSATIKSASLEYIVWIARDLSGKPFESAGLENYLLCVILIFTSEISLVTSLHDSGP